MERTGSATSDTGLRRSSRRKSRALSVASQHDDMADARAPRTPGRSTRRSARHLRSVSAVEDPAVEKEGETSVNGESGESFDPQPDASPGTKADVSPDEKPDVTLPQWMPHWKRGRSRFALETLHLDAIVRPICPSLMATTTPAGRSRKSISTGRRRRSRSRALEEAAYRPSKSRTRGREARGPRRRRRCGTSRSRVIPKPTSKGKGKATSSPAKSVSNMGRTTRSRASSHSSRTTHRTALPMTTTTKAREYGTRTPMTSTNFRLGLVKLWRWLSRSPGPPGPASGKLAGLKKPTPLPRLSSRQNLLK